jgi:UDP-hydrolysing UDP-N-acetyl-D-glucosamine 2-epimerase
MKRIGIVTTSRSDYGSCLPILRAIQADPDLDLHLLVTGMHLSPEFGCTVKEIEAERIRIGDWVEMLLSSDSPEGIAKSIGLGTIGFAQSFARIAPDILLLVGDRFELLALASAALPFRIPIAHVSGGDVTEGAVDNQVRHAISKMSHVHFVAMQEHADRLIQMGEEPWRVVVTGDPALDLISQMRLMNRAELSESLGMELEPPVLLATFHPTTLGSVSVLDEVDSLLSALSRVEGAMIFTYPNADTHGRIIIERIREFISSRPKARLFFNLGQLKYYSLLAQVDLMVGNSSSGIWEAPSFRLPVVNIGDRQRGRLRAGNVIDVASDAEAIHRAIREGLTPAFRASLAKLQNPYGDGQAAPRIIEVLKQIEIGPALLQKRFIDLPVASFEQARSGCRAEKSDRSLPSQ